MTTWPEETYFVTMTVVNWIDLFTRREYKDFLVENLHWCRINKGMEIFSYVIMTNHVHLVARTTEEPLNKVLGHFKTYTSKKLVEMLKEHPKESRRQWLINAFSFFGKKNVANRQYQVWQNDNCPIRLYTPKVIDQKVNYIHDNPVRAGFVDEPHHYYYSSAHPASPLAPDPL